MAITNIVLALQIITTNTTYKVYDRFIVNPHAVNVEVRYEEYKPNTEKGVLVHPFRLAESLQTIARRPLKDCPQIMSIGIYNPETMTYGDKIGYIWVDKLERWVNKNIHLVPW